MDRFLLASNPLNKPGKQYIVDTYLGCIWEMRVDALSLEKEFGDIDTNKLDASLKQAMRWWKSLRQAQVDNP